MNRRELLSIGLASGALATARVLNSGADVLERGRDGLSERIESMEQRFDRLEHHQKNLVRAGAFAFGISTGIDLLAFL